MPAQAGIGELSLLMPALAQLTANERHIALIAPPYVPYEDILWTFEQTLRCRSFGAVLAWPTAVRDKDIRRVQLAAEAGRSIGFLYRKPAAARESTPAALHFRLPTDADGQLAIDIIKCRGGRPASIRHVARTA
jgi:hypothetical protein